MQPHNVYLSPGACQNHWNKFPLSPAVISSRFEAWNLISTFYPSCITWAIITGHKIYWVPPLWQCDPGVGLLWSGSRAKWGALFFLISMNLHIQTKIMLLPEKGAHFLGKLKDYQGRLECQQCFICSIYLVLIATQRVMWNYYARFKTRNPRSRVDVPHAHSNIKSKCWFEDSSLSK